MFDGDNGEEGTRDFKIIERLYELSKLPPALDWRGRVSLLKVHWHRESDSTSDNQRHSKAVSRFACHRTPRRKRANREFPGAWLDQ
jgi:hypothetical protein